MVYRLTVIAPPRKSLHIPEAVEVLAARRADRVEQASSRQRTNRIGPHAEHASGGAGREEVVAQSRHRGVTIPREPSGENGGSARSVSYVFLSCRGGRPRLKEGRSSILAVARSAVRTASRDRWW
jgi:hypothetical protein